ncbi:MAG: phosphatase PAP2-related protein [bacterium]|nr:phosphatase PAP2-related protein [bacterium]MDZ4299367.1 phosphatase PAP2-related protein [Candidatus Sungbacteria bacterium]
MTIAERYAKLFSSKVWIISVAIGFFLFSASLVANYFAGIYAEESASNKVTDLILSNIPVFDVDILFIYGAVVLFFIITGIALAEPERLPFLLKSIALFVFIRSFFITFTHIKPAVDGVILSNHNPLAWVTFGGDLFFSGHTGIPFLMALIFWDQPVRRFLFLGTSFVLSAAVLMGHLHYSIDVFAAFFITYSIADLAKFFFAKDYHLFLQGTIKKRE